MKVTSRLRKIIYKHFSNVLELGNDYRVACIFHTEKDPSLSIDKETGVFHCFGCGKAGQYRDLLKALGEKDRRKKIHSLDDEFWDEVKSKLTADKKKKIHRHPMPVGFKRFSKYTVDNKYHSYMTDRGFNLSTLEYFKVGYVPAKIASRYRNRVVVPVCDVNGKLFFPEGRAIDDSQLSLYYSKYMRPKKIDKSELLSKMALFNYCNVRKEKWVILVEGIMDCMTLWGEWRFPSVASFNPRLSNYQIKLLSIYEKIYFCFDKDKAGIIGEDIAINGDFKKRKLIPLKGKGIELYHVPMPKNMDANKLTFKRFSKYLNNSELIEV